MADTHAFGACRDGRDPDLCQRCIDSLTAKRRQHKTRTICLKLTVWTERPNADIVGIVKEALTEYQIEHEVKRG